MLPNSGSQRTPRVPIKRRRTTGIRAQDACINCKERKLKCDDQLPTCANCARQGQSCLVEYPNTKRRGPRNYVETLEERVAQLEALLQERESSTDADNSPTPNRLVNEQNSVASVTVQISEDADARSQLASEVGMLSLNAAGAEPHYLGSSSAFAFSRIISSSLQKLVPLKPNAALGSFDDHITNLTPCPLPDYETGMILSNAYFRNIHSQYPFLHEPSFRVLEAKVMRPALGIDDAPFDPVALFFVNMVYAIGALLLPRAEQPLDRMFSDLLSKRLYITAQLYVGHVVEQDNLEAIQALLCCAMYSLRSLVGPSIWKLSGLALRQCIELGYHRRVKRTRLTREPLRLEMQKRVFWCAYVIDCTAASMLGRPLGIPPQEIDAEFPLDVNDHALTATEICETPRRLANDAPTTMSNPIHVIRLRWLWARIHTSLYSDTSACDPCDSAYICRIQKLRAEADEWRASAPPLVPREDPLTIFATQDWFDLNYSGTILYIYRGQLIAGRGTSEETFTECVQAAKTICHKYRRLYVGQQLNYTWGAIQVIFTAGLLYLHCLWTSPGVRASTRLDEFTRVCKDCTRVLAVMAERWQGAAPFCDIFEALFDGTMTMLTEEGQKDSEMAIPQSVANDIDQGDMSRWMAEIGDLGTSDWIDDFLTGLIHDHPSEAVPGQSNESPANPGGHEFSYLDTSSWPNS